MPRDCGAGAGPFGGSSWSRVSLSVLALRLIAIVTLGLLVQGPAVPAAAQTAGAEATAPDSPAAPAAPGQTAGVHTTDRDSLILEIRTYTQMIRSIRDSLSGAGSGLNLSPAQKEKFENNIDEFSQVVDRISNQLSRMEFEIKDNRISLVNEAGEGIVINVPEDLDTEVSRGIKAITQVILSELPDSVDFDHAGKWDWKSFRPDPPPPERRVINGNIVKVWQDVHISEKEDVRGNVVVIFGDAEISGRVDGSVVTVFGNLLLDARAEITGSVVAAGGYLDQDPEAQVEDVVAIDPLQRGRGEGWMGLFRHDGVSFMVCQGMFLLTVLLAVLGVVVTPRRRFDAVTAAVSDAPLTSFAVGLVTALAGHAVVAVLIAVLVLTVIGVPLALLVGMLLVVVAVLGVAAAGAVLGEKICRLVGGRCPTPWLVVLVGMSALHAVSFLGSILGLMGSPEAFASVVVVLGMTIKILAYLVGLGAIVRSRFGRPAATT